MASPVFTSREGFTRSPFTVTLPPSIAVTAIERDLKNRAAQSHLSTRTDAVPAACSRAMADNMRAALIVFTVALGASPPPRAPPRPRGGGGARVVAVLGERGGAASRRAARSRRPRSAGDARPD